METCGQTPHKVPQGGFALWRPCENKEFHVGLTPASTRICGTGRPVPYGGLIVILAFLS